MSWLMKFGLILFGVAAIAGGIGYLIQSGEKINEAKHIKADAVVETNILKRAVEVAGDFAKLGSDVVAKVQNVRTETTTVVQTQVKYVKAHPLPAVCMLNDAVIELRDGQIRALYQAAGRQLPGDSNGGRGPPAPNDKQRPGNGHSQ